VWLPSDPQQVKALRERLPQAAGDPIMANRNMTRRFGMVAAALTFMIATATARADLITYTEQAVGSGGLGGTAYTNALVTITFTGDTANVTGGSGFFINTVGTTTVTVAGLGLATFTDTMGAFDNQTFNPAFVGIGDLTQGASVLDTDSSAAWLTYDLKSAIGRSRARHSFARI
jgi:hypothetical protein